MLRIISQDTTADIPYERASLEITRTDTADGKFLIKAFSGDSIEADMGTYSTLKRARTALYQLHDVFMRCNNEVACGYVANAVYDFPADDGELDDDGVSGYGIPDGTPEEEISFL